MKPTERRPRGCSVCGQTGADMLSQQCVEHPSKMNKRSHGPRVRLKHSWLELLELTLVYNQELFTTYTLLQTIATTNKECKAMVNRVVQVVTLPRTSIGQERFIACAHRLHYLKNVVRLRIGSLESLLHPSTERVLHCVHSVAKNLRTIDLCQRFEAIEVMFLLDRIPFLRRVTGPLRIGPESSSRDLSVIGQLISSVEFTGWFQSDTNTRLLRDWSGSVHAVFPYLKKINLSHAIALGCEDVITIARGQPSLTHLNLNFCIKLTSDTLIKVCQTCTSLESLKLAGIPGCDDSVGRALRNHKFLKELDLSWCPNVGDATICAIAELTYLSSIRLAGTGASVRSLTGFFRSTKAFRLEVLSLSKNYLNKPNERNEAMVQAVLARAQLQQHDFRINQKLLRGDGQHSTEARIRSALRIPLPVNTSEAKRDQCSYCACSSTERCDSCDLCFCNECVDYLYCADCTKLVGMVNPEDTSETCCGQYYEQNYCSQCDSGFCEECRTVESCSECEETICEACGVTLCCAQCCETFCVSCRETITCSVCLECVCESCLKNNDWCDACECCFDCCGCGARDKPDRPGFALSY